MIARAASHGYPLLALEVGYAGTGGKMPERHENATRLTIYARR
jgi:hypothetical protein